MKTSIAVLALAGAALANPIVERQACPDSYPQTFTINNVLAPATKRDLSSRQLDGTLRLSLSGGVLKDQAGRIGYIAANRQFQFDNPVQAGAIKQAGFSVCPDGRLRLDGSATFYQCQSGNFYNLYDQSQGGQCQSINFQVQNAAGGAASSGASQISDGQPQATSARVSQISDGQPQATSARVSQISDGQVQATSARPAVTQISDGQVQATSARPAVTQISDGQIQATSARPAVTQISDGQIQATSARPAPATFTGGAHRELAGGFAFAAGIVGAIALL